MTHYTIKVLISAIMIVAVTELSKRSSLLGGLLASLPLVSLLAMLWLYLDTKDAGKVAALSSSIFWLVLPSMVFFLALPVLLKLKFNFYLKDALGSSGSEGGPDASRQLQMAGRPSPLHAGIVSISLRRQPVLCSLLKPHLSGKRLSEKRTVGSTEKRKKNIAKLSCLFATVRKRPLWDIDKRLHGLVGCPIRHRPSTLVIARGIYPKPVFRPPPTKLLVAENVECIRHRDKF